MARFILIHGTFTLKANWPVLIAGIKKTCEDLNVPSTFEEVTWTGSNSFDARETAAEDLKEKIKLAKAANPSEPIFAIAHSHGGNALAKYRKLMDWGAYDMLAGSAFLSTPFIAMRQRKGAARLLFAIFLLPTLLMTYFCLVIWPNSGLDAMDTISNTSWWQWVFYSFPGALLSIFCSFVSYAEAHSYDQILLTQTCDMPRGNNIFLRFTGDEAAAALSATQFFAWAASSISRVVRRYLWTDYVIANILLNIIVTAVFATVYRTTVLSVYNSSLSETIMAVEDYVATAFGSMDLRAIGISIFVGLAYLLLSLIVGAVITAIFCFTWQAIATRAFGWGSIMHGLVIELAVEPLPFGDNKLLSLDWGFGPDEGIVHSWTYGDPRAVKYVQDWISESLVTAKTNTSAPALAAPPSV